MLCDVAVIIGHDMASICAAKSQSPLPCYPHDGEEDPGECCEKYEHMIEIVETAAAELAIAYSSSFVL